MLILFPDLQQVVAGEGEWSDRLVTCQRSNLNGGLKRSNHMEPFRRLSSFVL